MSWLFINTSAAAAASTPPSGHIPSKTIEMSCRRIAALFYRRLRSSSRYVLGHFSPFFFVRAYSYCSSSRPQILSAEPKMSSISSSSPIASREIQGDRCKEGVDDTSFSLLRESGPREWWGCRLPLRCYLEIWCPRPNSLASHRSHWIVTNGCLPVFRRLLRFAGDSLLSPIDGMEERGPERKWRRDVLMRLNSRRARVLAVKVNSA